MTYTFSPVSWNTLPIPYFTIEWQQTASSGSHLNSSVLSKSGLQKVRATNVQKCDLTELPKWNHSPALTQDLWISFIQLRTKSAREDVIKSRTYSPYKAKAHPKSACMRTDYLFSVLFLFFIFYPAFFRPFNDWARDNGRPRVRGCDSMGSQKTAQTAFFSSRVFVPFVSLVLLEFSFLLSSCLSFPPSFSVSSFTQPWSVIWIYGLLTYIIGVWYNQESWWKLYTADGTPLAEVFRYQGRAPGLRAEEMEGSRAPRWKIRSSS